MTDPVRRKLTTIFSADAAGYSRLMERDETGTLQTLRASIAAMSELIARHDGRVVNTAGDGLLAEFPSVVEALQCATEVQRELDARNAARPEAGRMRFRIGLNLGDVMVAGEDLYGEGVNVAARLQALAEPGGICISGTVYDHVRGKLSLGYDYIGRQRVKNISEEVRTYRVMLDGGAGPPEAPAPADETAGGEDTAPGGGPGAEDADEGNAAQRFRARVVRAGMLIVLLFAVDLFTGGGWWFYWPALFIAFATAMSGADVLAGGAERRARWWPRPPRWLRRHRRWPRRH